MSLGLLGYKRGMSQVFSEDGVSVPVTVVEVFPNRVTQIKTRGIDGYSAVQVTYGTRSASKLTKPALGKFSKVGVQPGSGLVEFRVDPSVGESVSLADEFAVNLFAPGQLVDVTADSKGKGFAGVIKRHNFSSQDATHGNSLSHNAPGSIGQRQSPRRVFKGKKMAGQLGNKRCTVQSLEVVHVDVDRNFLLIKGSVPGPKGARVLIKKAIRDRG